MTAHTNCTHPATSAGRAACRKGGGPIVNPNLPRVTSVTARDESRRRRVEVTDDNYLEIAKRVSEKWTRQPWPTDEERAASLTKVWCGRCHLLHDSDAACVSEPARRVPGVTQLSEDTFQEAVAVRKNDAARSAANDLPTFANARARAADIPDGRYAVREADGTIKFYKIDKPVDGRWAGYVFLKVIASDNEFPIKLAARQMAVFDAILDATPQASMALYGHSIGQCGRCGRALTDPESIARGIGPVCAARCGW